VPTAGAYTSYKTQLAADCKSAWGANIAVHFGWPRTEQRNLPYAVCVFDKLVNDLGGAAATVRGAHQVYAWTVILISPIPPANVNLQDFKVEKGDLLALKLEANIVYASVGMNPIAAEIDYSERWDYPGSEAACTVTVSFMSMVSRPWGT